MNDQLLLGSHISTSGGVHTAFERGASIGCTTMQVFTKNNNQWRAPALSTNDIQTYKTAEAKARIAPVVAHAAYLINLCATNAATLKQSRTALADELRRCNAYGIRALIFHPGAHVGAGEEAGIAGIGESINIVHAETPDVQTFTTLETTAGQGTALGYRFEQLALIIDQVEQKQRMAVCVDTCHLFAAGYDIRTQEGWDNTMQQFDDVLGLHRLVAIHVNDSKKGFGSRVDRHEHIGKGLIGLDGFRAMMNDPRLDRIPKILETEKSEDMHEDTENMSVLRSLVSSTAVLEKDRR